MVRGEKKNTKDAPRCFILAIEEEEEKEEEEGGGMLLEVSTA